MALAAAAVLNVVELMMSGLGGIGVAHSMIKAAREQGGIFTEDDFAGYEARWVKPISIGYRGTRSSPLRRTPADFRSFKP